MIRIFLDISKTLHTSSSSFRRWHFHAQGNIFSVVQPAAQTGRCSVHDDVKRGRCSKYSHPTSSTSVPACCQGGDVFTPVLLLRLISEQDSDGGRASTQNRQIQEFISLISWNGLFSWHFHSFLRWKTSGILRWLLSKGGCWDLAEVYALLTAVLLVELLQSELGCRDYCWVKNVNRGSGEVVFFELKVTSLCCETNRPNWRTFRLWWCKRKENIHIWDVWKNKMFGIFCFLC